MLGRPPVAGVETGEGREERGALCPLPGDTQVWWPAVAQPATYSPRACGGQPGIPRCPSDVVSADASDRQWTALQGTGPLAHSPDAGLPPAPPAQPGHRPTQPGVWKKTFLYKAVLRPRALPMALSVHREAGAVTRQGPAHTPSGSLCSSTWPGPIAQAGLSLLPVSRGASRWLPRPEWRKKVFQAVFCSPTLGPWLGKMPDQEGWRSVSECSPRPVSRPLPRVRELQTGPLPAGLGCSHLPWRGTWSLVIRGSLSGPSRRPGPIVTLPQAQGGGGSLDSQLFPSDTFRPSLRGYLDPGLVFCAVKNFNPLELLVCPLARQVANCRPPFLPYHPFA